MSKLFSPFSLGSHILTNRFVRSATSECFATETGCVTEDLLNMYRDLAGGCGLIISGNALVSQTGKSERKMISAAADSFIPDLTELANIVKGSGSKFVLQLLHCGGQTVSRISGAEVLAPSPGNYYGDEARAMTIAEIEETIASFIAAAVRAQKAGFDGVQLHSAHGYLLSQFLTPRTNCRKDEYGGSWQNRSSILVKIVEGIRQATSPDFLIMVKINCTDFIPDGLTIDETKLICQSMQKVGLDAVEISGGTIHSSRQWIFGQDSSQETEAFFRSFAAEIKRSLSIPVILVGGLRNRRLMEEILDSGDADLISMCRPLICEPDLIQKFEQNITEVAACISCNLCTTNRNKHGVRCWAVTA